MSVTLKRTDTVFDLYKFTDRLTFYIVDKFDMFYPTKSVTNNAEKVVSYILNKYISKSRWFDVTVSIYYKDTLGDIDQIFWNKKEEGDEICCYFVPDADIQKQREHRKNYITESIEAKKLILIEKDIIVSK